MSDDDAEERDFSLQYRTNKGSVAIYAKGVRLDIYADDGEIVYNVEMQTSDKDDLARRSRFYQSQIDIECLQKGEKYYTLKNNFVVFICTFDLFEKGLPIYTFQNVCKEDHGIYLEDGTTKVFLNATAYANTKDKKLAEFLRFVNTVNNKTFATEDTFIGKLANDVEAIKDNEEWSVEFMSLNATLDFEKWQGEIKGRIEGEIKGKMSVAKIMIQKGFSVEEIMEFTKLSLADIESLKNKIIVE